MTSDDAALQGKCSEVNSLRLKVNKASEHVSSLRWPPITDGRVASGSSVGAVEHENTDLPDSNLAALF